MPFNASGVFQRLFNWCNDRDAGIKILAERLDQETDGIVAGINDLVQGNVALKGPVKTVFGTAANPAYTFADETNDGLFRKTDASIGVSIAGVEVGSFPASFFTEIADHHAATDNPHNVTAALVGAYTTGQTAEAIAQQASEAGPPLRYINLASGNANAKGFVGAFGDANQVYFVPYNNGAPHGLCAVLNLYNYLPNTPANGSI